MRLRLLLIALLGASLAREARAESLKLPELPAETIRLANGLTVLLAPDPGARLASVVVSYGAGAADDPNGKLGLAHLTEHLVAGRTKHVSSGARVLAAAGASRFNAQTRLDTTNYFESVPPERLESMLWLESERMGFALDAVTEEAVAAEHEVIQNEDRGRGDAALASIGALTGEELYPPWHPYSVLGAGAADLDSLDAADVKAFLRTWYTPENAVLAIAGRFDRNATLALVRRYFESIPSVAAPVRPPLPDWSAPGLELSVDAAVPSDGVMLEWQTPAFGVRDDAALDLAAAALSGAGNGRFARSLIATHLATSITAAQHSEARASRFVVQATAAPGVTPDMLVHAIQKTIDDFARGAAPGEIARTREIWRHTFLQRLEAPWGRATLLAEAPRIGLAVGPSFHWGLARYESLQDEDVNRAAAEWLTLRHRLAIGVFANSHAANRGRLTGREEVTR